MHLLVKFIANSMQIRSLILTFFSSPTFYCFIIIKNNYTKYLQYTATATATQRTHILTFSPPGPVITFCVIRFGRGGAIARLGQCYISNNRTLMNFFFHFLIATQRNSFPFL